MTDTAWVTEMLALGDITDIIRERYAIMDERKSLQARCGAFGTAENRRKMLLSAKEIDIRTTAERVGTKVTDKSVDALAHADPAYAAFIDALERDRTNLYGLDAKIVFLDALIDERRRQAYEERTP